MSSNGTVELSAVSCSPGIVVACSVVCGRVMRWYGNVGLGAARSVMWWYRSVPFISVMYRFCVLRPCRPASYLV